jgi:ribulose-5-phosphate 4-epimerase/fuculose-1-phosphate aldolase
VNFITWCGSGPVVAASAAKTPLFAMLDDFAQLAGRHILCADGTGAEAVTAALGKRAGVLVPGCGALCCEKTASDVQAVALVMEKNAYAQVAAALQGTPRHLSAFDCFLMRAVYKLSYSKKA